MSDVKVGSHQDPALIAEWMEREDVSPADFLAALTQGNRSVAAAFCKEPRVVRVELFVLSPLLASHYERHGRTLGVSDTASWEVGLRMTKGWRATWIHELVHLYNPGAGESEVRRLTAQVIAHLKLVHGAVAEPRQGVWV